MKNEPDRGENPIEPVREEGAQGEGPLPQGETQLPQGETQLPHQDQQPAIPWFGPDALSLGAGDQAEKGAQAVCPVCGGLNRVPRDARAAHARCGHCRAPLLRGRAQAVREGRWRRVASTSHWPVVTWVVDPTSPMGNHWEASVSAAFTRVAGRAQVLCWRADLDREAGAKAGLGALPGLLFSLRGRVHSSLCGGLNPEKFSEWFDRIDASSRES